MRLLLLFEWDRDFEEVLVFNVSVVVKARAYMYLSSVFRSSRIDSDLDSCRQLFISLKFWRTIIWRTKSFSRRVPSLHTPSTCLWNAVAAVERESAAFNGVYVPLSFFWNVDGAPTLTFNQLGCSQWGLRHVRNVDLYGQWSQCSEHERADCNILGRSQRPRRCMSIYLLLTPRVTPRVYTPSCPPHPMWYM